MGKRMGTIAELHKAFARCAEQDKANAAETSALQTTLADLQQQLIGFSDRQTTFETVIAELLSWAKAQGYEGSGQTQTETSEE